MNLKQLFKGISGLTIRGPQEIDITGVCDDSRIVAPGNLFVARRGSSFHGADFISQAVASGAQAVVTDLYDPFISATQIIAKCPSEIAALLANRFYANPSSDLFVVGTTGTKGKTTTAYMVRHLLEGLGLPAGLMSTVETIVGDKRFGSQLTTHGAVQNQKLLREMVSSGCKAASLEVSSHGLDQGRLDQIALDVAIWTNLHADHLDYHATIGEYARAKQKLFAHLDKSPKKNRRALLNADNSWCAEMREKCASPVWTFGIESSADIMASDISLDGTKFTVTFAGQKELFQIPLMGRFNVYNALGAIGVGLHRNAMLSQIASILHTVPAVPGRLEQVPNERGILVFVDYAHTGNALENMLATLREIARKRILCVFGCGGDRDPRRRTEMAKVAQVRADVSIITSDNPRKEEPLLICEQIRKAFDDPALPLVILDRAAAIAHAIGMAAPGDVVLIAGKGHEKTQVFANKTVAFDDVLVAKEALQ